jgi:hypothetical protein
MKTLKTILALLTFALLTISCSDDDMTEPVTYKAEPITNNEEMPYNKENSHIENGPYNEENPLDTYLANSGFNQETSEYVDFEVIHESGFSFKPVVSGKINSIIVKIPYVNTALRVTLWNVATRSVIKSVVVNVPTADLAVEKTITPIALNKDKEYLISVKSAGWIRRSKTDGSAAEYPILAGNIIITGFAATSVTGKVEEFIYPEINSDIFYKGDVSFKFQQTE